jgi:hypothetical protein
MLMMKLLAKEYASYFLGGLEGITRRQQDRINEIEDAVKVMGVEWDVFKEEVMKQFSKINED